MPLPQADELAVTDSTGSDAASPKLQFSYVECLMYAFHQVGRRCPQFLTAEENAERLKDFRMRLCALHFNLPEKCKYLYAPSKWSELWQISCSYFHVCVSAQMDGP